ncbi:MAG TPA: anaerobic C4-dicarboxylate transporter family protein [Aeromicrobium sp.]|nr:anaerobic C4-dicarboxylate transporter family protein [Aeromicrobium sp.]
MDTILILEALVLIGAIYLGVRTGGIGLGLWGAVGVLILLFVFQAPSGDIPRDAIMVILAVITAASAMQAAGGIEWMVTVAEKIIRSRPAMVNFLAPVITFLFCAGAGTGNIAFPLLPVIYEVAYERGIRPERALGPSVAASGIALAASPVSAAMAAFVGLTSAQGDVLSLGQILMITIPAGLVAVLASALLYNKWGKDLQADEEYLRRREAGLIDPPGKITATDHEINPHGKPAAIVFLCGVLAIVVLGMFDQFIPPYGPVDPDNPKLSLTTLLIVLMLVVALAVMYVGKVKPAQVLEAPLTKSGLTAIIALLGIAWLANTFIADNNDTIMGALTEIATDSPWFLAIAMFIVAGMTTSQSASVNTMIPLGMSLGIATPTLAAYLPAMGGVFLLPANGTQLAAVEIDQTGSTKIGKYVLNHSFLVPTLIQCFVAVVIGLGIARVMF